MTDTALVLRERAEFLLRIAPRAATSAAASLESLAREYLRRAEELERDNWSGCSPASQRKSGTSASQ
jgi:hypothetical protein